MIYFLWFFSLVTAFFLGYFLRGINNRVKILEQEVKKKNSPVIEEPKSTIVDPLDPVQEAEWNQKEMMRKLNEGPHS